MKADKKLLIPAVIILYLLVIKSVIVPNWQAAGKFKKEAAVLNKELNSLIALNTEHLSARSGLEAALRRDGSAGILSTVQKKTQKMGLSAKLKAVTPIVRNLNSVFQLEGYDFFLEGVSLKEIIIFSESMQKEEGFYLDRLVLEKNKDGMSLSARLRILTIKRL